MPYEQDLPYAPHSETSYEGAKAAQPKAGTQSALVLAAIRAHGPLSDHELVALTQLRLNIVNARRHQLVRHGLVEAADTALGKYGVVNRRWRIR